VKYLLCDGNKFFGGQQAKEIKKKLQTGGNGLQCKM
jgi:hypothetical protein